MGNAATKTRRITSPLLNREAKISARKRVIGIWKGQYKGMVKENKKLRKEWGKRIKKLGW